MLQDNLRVDGRTREGYRCMEVETDVVSNASGSARLRLVCVTELLNLSNAVALYTGRIVYVSSHDIVIFNII